MRIGMNMLLWTTHVTEADYPHIKAIQRAGFDGIEIPLFEGDAAHFRALRKVLDDNGLTCSTVTVSGEDTNPISSDAVIRRAAVDDLKRKIEFSAILGSDVMVGPFHQPLGVFSGDGPSADEKSRAAEVHRAAAVAAAGAGLKLGIEYLNRFECYFLNTAADAVAHVKRVGHPAFSTMYDTFHANIEEKDPIAAYRDHAEHIVHFHVSENDRGTPGKGSIPWTETFRALRASAYDGWLTIEAFGRALKDLAAATKVWRDFSETPEAVYREGYRHIRDGWASAA